MTLNEFEAIRGESIVTSDANRIFLTLYDPNSLHKKIYDAISNVYGWRGCQTEYTRQGSYYMYHKNYVIRISSHTPKLYSWECVNGGNSNIDKFINTAINEFKGEVFIDTSKMLLDEDEIVSLVLMTIGINKESTDISFSNG